MVFSPTTVTDTAVLEYDPTEILPQVGALSKHAERLCRPGRQASRAHPRGKPGFWSFESGCGRETDSLLEGTGFEPSVPPRKGADASCVGSLSPDLSVGGEPTRGDIERLVVSRGTDGSNPIPSSKESAANLTSSITAPRIWRAGGETSNFGSTSGRPVPARRKRSLARETPRRASGRGKTSEGDI